MEFCYARVGRGIPAGATDAAGRDTLWLANAVAARDVGLPVGGYWRFFPERDLERQVLLFTGRMLEADPLQLPPLVDIEDADGLTPAPLTDWAIRCLQRVQQLTGVQPVLYTNRWFLANALQADRLLPGWPLSLAAYVDQEEWIDPRATWWQYAENVRPDWASGPVDLQRHRGALT